MTPDAMTPDAGRRPAVEIARLRPGDWAAVREIRLTALAQAPDAFFSTLEQEQGFDEQEWRRRLAATAYFGAWSAGPEPGLVGLVATFPEAPPHGRTWHLVAMWVSPACRGQGIADRLAAAVCDLARARGADQVALWVADANPRGRAAYRRLGFWPTGERGVLRAAAPGQEELWEARMTRDLREPPAASSS